MRKVEGVAERGVRGFNGKTRLKCLMSFGQVTANIGFTCSVTFPPIFERILNVFAVLNMDLLPALGLACRKSNLSFSIVEILALPRKRNPCLYKFYHAGVYNVTDSFLFVWCLTGFPDFDYMNKLLVVTIFPLIVLSTLGLMYTFIAVRAKITGKPDKRGATVIYVFLFFTFLILVQCSSTVFDFFQCKSFPEALNEFGEIEEKRYLNRDYSVDCNSPRYFSFIPYGLIMIAVRLLESRQQIFDYNCINPLYQTLSAVLFKI